MKGPSRLSTRAALTGLAVALLPAWPSASAGIGAQPASDVTAVVETDPVASSRDAADDTAIWVHPTDPSQSVVIGTDKQAALEVYDLSGARLQRLPYSVGPPNNVDLRRSFLLGGRSVDIIGAAGSGRMRFWTIDPDTRLLTNVTARDIPTQGDESGFCMYRSPISGRTYAFVVNRDTEQYELFGNDGRVDVATVRGPWDHGTVGEGCVADNELGHLYLSEEGAGIWKYGAEPGDSTEHRVQVDITGAGGHLSADVEGLEVVPQPSGSGYLVASSQGDSRFVLYERQGDNRFIGRFGVLDGAHVDGCSFTDGISATPQPLNAAFPHGLFVCQDNTNRLPGSEGNQNFKLVPLEAIVGP